MELKMINYIKNNPMLYTYLRDNSYWYKELNRNSQSLKRVEEAMKKYYKLTPTDKLQKISKQISLVSNILDILK